MNIPELLKYYKSEYVSIFAYAWPTAGERAFSILIIPRFGKDYKEYFPTKGGALIKFELIKQRYEKHRPAIQVQS
jgi:hypothetical protein